VVLEDPILDTLAELERAADEVVDESIDPPKVAAASNRAQVSPEGTAGRDAGVARVPKRRSNPAPARASASWGAVDALILLLAALVFAASVIGLIWLL
jgi:hypothetical protein